MNKIIVKIIFMLFLSLNSSLIFADTIAKQNVITNPTTVSNSTAPVATKVQMADLMYENGKIYVVVLVLLTIFAGIILFLVFLEKKISKLEKK